MSPPNKCKPRCSLNSIEILLIHNVQCRMDSLSRSSFLMDRRSQQHGTGDASLQHLRSRTTKDMGHRLIWSQLWDSNFRDSRCRHCTLHFHSC